MKIYISHSRVNASSALRLCHELRKRSLDAWLDVCNLAPGAEWDQCVSDAIHAASAFVFILGPPGPTDRWQNFEWQQVVNNEYYLDPAKPLIPVLIGNPDVPGFLKSRQAFVLDDAPASWDQVADDIANAVQNPETSVDPHKLELGRKARQQALESFREYSQSLEAGDIRRAGLRAIE